MVKVNLCKYQIPPRRKLFYLLGFAQVRALHFTRWILMYFKNCVVIFLMQRKTYQYARSMGHKVKHKMVLISGLTEKMVMELR